MKTATYLPHLVFTLASILGAARGQNNAADLIVVNANIFAGSPSHPDGSDERRGSSVKIGLLRE